ncbi:Cytochrome P450 82C4 [Striga hermonthica]|uniref:Flavonoid-6-hydroxylase n=1 Tax=Striga hermonthica TaxID=68872 RepID=A0A9N7RNS0_STRHE|nr:Cytochrome P450 82C4 [Striga hermonthica]
MFGAINCIIALVLALFYFLRLSRWSHTHRPKASKRKSPPEVGGARLFTGHLHLLSPAGGLPHFKLADLSDTYGPIFTIRLGVRRALVVSSWELAKSLFTTCDAAISSRPKLRAGKHLSHNYAMFGFSPYGPFWRRMRKLISFELLSARRLETQTEVRMSETAQSVGELFRAWEERRDGSGRALVDMKRWFGDLSMNIVLRMVVGKRFSGSGEETGRWQEVMRDFFKLAGQFVVADALPYLRWLDIGGHEKRMKKNARELDGIVRGWLEEHRHRQGEYSPDFMDIMLSVSKEARLHTEYDDDTIIKATCESLISGGTDTTVVMLVWAFSLILNNPHVLKKAQEELDRHVGKQRQVEESDIRNLVYLQAITKETLRLYPAGPLGGTREFSEDCTVGGYHVPKGTWLLVNLWKLHRDPHVWGPDALEFKPERFLSIHKNMDVRGSDFELIPFGAGRRICPGSNLGLQMMHFVLANLLHSFDFWTEGDEGIDMTESAGLTTMKATPLDINTIFSF